MRDEQFRTYLFSYRHDGDNWCFEVKAPNLADAKSRVSKMAFAVYDGELAMRIPHSFGWFARCVVWVRNIWKF